jgi:hypothetical protein
MKPLCPTLAQCPKLLKEPLRQTWRNFSSCDMNSIVRTLAILTFSSSASWCVSVVCSKHVRNASGREDFDISASRR